MGWLFSYNNFTRREQVADLVNRHHLIDHAVVGNTLYGVYRFGLYDCGIMVYLLANSRDGYGYKDIGEECVPAVFTCPERILRQSTLPDSGWRKACRDNRKQVFKLKDGLPVRFTAAVLPREFKGLRDFVVRRIQTAYGRPYWTFIAVQDASVRYKLTNKQQHLYGLELVV